MLHAHLHAHADLHHDHDERGGRHEHDDEQHDEHQIIGSVDSPHLHSHHTHHEHHHSGGDEEQEQQQQQHHTHHSDENDDQHHQHHEEHEEHHREEHEHSPHLLGMDSMALPPPLSLSAEPQHTHSPTAHMTLPPMMPPSLPGLAAFGGLGPSALTPNLSSFLSSAMRQHQGGGLLSPTLQSAQQVVTAAQMQAHASQIVAAALQQQQQKDVVTAVAMQAANAAAAVASMPLSLQMAVLAPMLFSNPAANAVRMASHGAAMAAAASAASASAGMPALAAAATAARLVAGRRKLAKQGASAASAAGSDATPRKRQYNTLSDETHFLIIDLHHKDHLPQDISTKLGVKLKTVYTVLSRYKATGQVWKKPKGGNRRGTVTAAAEGQGAYGGAQQNVQLSFIGGQLAAAAAAAMRQNAANAAAAAGTAPAPTDIPMETSPPQLPGHSSASGTDSSSSPLPLRPLTAVRTDSELLSPVLLPFAEPALLQQTRHVHSATSEKTESQHRNADDRGNCTEDDEAHDAHAHQPQLQLRSHDSAASHSSLSLSAHPTMHHDFSKQHSSDSGSSSSLMHSSAAQGGGGRLSMGRSDSLRSLLSDSGAAAAHHSSAVGSSSSAAASALLSSDSLVLLSSPSPLLSGARHSPLMCSPALLAQSHDPLSEAHPMSHSPRHHSLAQLSAGQTDDDNGLHAQEQEQQMQHSAHSQQLQQAHPHHQSLLHHSLHRNSTDQHVRG